ncbi:hypothetical protein N658DRAFT_444058 [Parathielavia hyrcaniae]|uniref:Uncharacterized protein n=1 Tax=Parathielavia hyrcaniae TaxID=113614 RepID=A0AAN6T4X3_9PEZI|nr:hypothetical protein N658DRAFT_444058 [Parathielavia hyrcaniae]
MGVELMLSGADYSRRVKRVACNGVPNQEPLVPSSVRRGHCSAHRVAATLWSLCLIPCFGPAAGALLRPGSWTGPKLTVLKERHIFHCSRMPTSSTPTPIIHLGHNKTNYKETGAMRNPSKMVNSLVWTPDEANYLEAIFRWQDTAASPQDEERRREAEDAARRAQEKKPTGEFRILVLGARGTGKTALLTRFGRGTSHGETHPPDPLFERRCRHPITLDKTPPTMATARPPTSPTTLTPGPPITKTNPHPSNNNADHAPQTQTQKQTQKQTYMIDALELPSKHLLSNPMLAQALSTTEAAVLVYSVRDEASFRLAQGLAKFRRRRR